MRVLICPLNWGIGHATRCMPIINDLLAVGAEVLVASDGEALKILRMEYPLLTHLELPSYSVRYPTESIILNLATRIPKILATIRREYDSVQTIVQQHAIDVVLSDNRFGCHSEQCLSIFMTHQVNIITPNRVLDKLIRRINTGHISNFDQCWIPDYRAAPGLSGHLGHDHHVVAKYIGPLSRMNAVESEQQYDFSVVLSGPEPQRTKLEAELLSKLEGTDFRMAFVGGNFTPMVPTISSKNITYYKLLNSKELQDIYTSSGFIICRSGYSSMMDLAVLGKKAVVIPTPGQTEQEYLADLYDAEGWHMKQEQGKFDLVSVLAQIQHFSGIPLSNGDEVEYDQAIQEVLDYRRKE